jgi:hypothetical protein
VKLLKLLAYAVPVSAIYAPVGRKTLETEEFYCKLQPVYDISNKMNILHWSDILMQEFKLDQLISAIEQR